MRSNGTLQFIQTSKGGFNEDGEPIKSVNVESLPIRCLITTVTNTSHGRYEDGKFNQYSYEILIEESSLPSDINRIKLIRGKKVLGEFPLQGNPIPTTMGRIKLYV